MSTRATPEPLEMSHKAWKKFDWNQQEVLTSCYANLNKGIDTMQNGIDSFSNAMDKMKMDESQNKKILNAFAPDNKKDVSIILGKTKQKDINIITGRKKSII